MREIKFRAKSKKNGKVVYGYYVPVMPMSSFPALISNDGYYQEIVPYTVQQFCGYDSEGNEIYEGNTVIAHDKEYTVKLVPKYGLFYDLKHCVKKINQH